MRLRSCMKAALVVGLFGAILPPAHAGVYHGGVAVARIAYAEAKLGNGGYGAAILAQYDGIDYEGMASVIPTAEFNPFPFVGTPYGDIGGNGNSMFLGCIVVRTSGGAMDGGCRDFTAPNDPANPRNLGEVLAPATLNMDPGMTGGNVTFSVESSIAGFQLTANLTLAASGDPAPLNVQQTSVYTPPGSKRPETLNSSEAHGAKRPATIRIGTIRSDILPGQPGVVVSTTRAGFAMSLVEGSYADLIHLFCTSEATPPDTPETVGGGLLPEIPTGLPHIWEKNRCYDVLPV